MSYPSVDQLQTPQDEYDTKVREIIKAAKKHIRNTDPLNYGISDVAMLAQLAANVKALEGARV